MSEVVSVSGDDFTGAASHESNTLTTWLKGNADYAALDALEMLLTRVHTEARRLAVGEVIVDLRQLEFMNSSCFKAFVTWISMMQDEADRRYRVTFLSNPAMRWQRRSLQALSCFAADIISVETRSA